MRTLAIKNRLLFFTWMSIGLFAVAGVSFPQQYIAILSSTALMIAGLWILKDYWRDTYEILFHHRRLEEAKGSHLAVYGVTLIALGLEIVGGSSLVYNVLNAPDWWSTVPSSFGRSVTAAGCFLMVYSPHVAAPEERPFSFVWTICMILLALVGVFFAGTRIQAMSGSEDWIFSQIHGKHRPGCAASMPIWVSSGGVYHPPMSKYRRTVIPKACFATEDEARRAGYRKALR